MHRLFGLVVALFFITATPGAQAPQTPPPLRGFTAAGSERERAAEEKFRAVPKPDNAREYMRTITAHPHHAGSPASRAVAEYILGQFKSWGLDASIESFEAMMPYPTERLVEMVAPESYTLKLSEPAVATGSDVGRCVRAADVQRLLGGRRRHRGAGLRQLRHARGLRGAREARRGREGKDRDRALRPQLARDQAEGRLRARRGRLHHLFGSARGRLFPRRCLP